MSSLPPPVAASRMMGIYEPAHLLSMWGESFKGSASPNTDVSSIVGVETELDNKSEDSSQGALGPSIKYKKEASKLSDKVLRRLAQNREAARKSRLRKKAYVQQLESSRLKLTQLEQELDHTRQQGLYVGGAYDTSHLGLPGTVDSGIATFEMEYRHWVEEQMRKTRELSTALQAHAADGELRMLVDSGMNHYFDLFRMKAAAAKADVFYIMSGMWKTSTERLFLWIGGYRPSELLKVLIPQLDLLTKQQLMDVYNLQQSSQQAEDALSQGMEKLQVTLAETLAADLLGAGSYPSQMATAMGKLDAIVSFVNQVKGTVREGRVDMAMDCINVVQSRGHLSGRLSGFVHVVDHLCQQSLLQMARILTIRQAARGLVALGDYFDRLRYLSEVWTAYPREPA